MPEQMLSFIAESMNFWQIQTSSKNDTGIKNQYKLHLITSHIKRESMLQYVKKIKSTKGL